MSKIFKNVEINRDQPLNLKDFQPKLIKRAKYVRNDTMEGKIAATLKRPREDDAKLLMEDAFNRSLQIVEDAKNKAEKILSEAQEKRDQVEEQAFQKGYEAGKSQGYKEGFDEAEAENTAVWDEYLKQFNKLRIQLKEQNQLFIGQLEKESLRIALNISEKILGTAIDIDLDYFISLIQQGLKMAGEEKDVVIRLAEEDYKRLDSLEDLSRLKNGVKKISLIKDPILSNGDCVIEADHFEIDAGIHTQLQNIMSSLEEMEVI